MPDTKMHHHGWDCFATSGGYTNAMDETIPLDERIETVYRTAYKTGYRNGLSDAVTCETKAQSESTAPNSADTAHKAGNDV